VTGHYYKFVIHCLFPVLIGITIYIQFRGFHSIIPKQNYWSFFFSMKIPNWIKYNLPDGLWFYALLSAIGIVWQEVSSVNFVRWIFLSIVLTYLSEILQAFHIIPGTFDWFDLLAYTIALFSFYFINFKQINKQLLLTFKITKT
jgi:hypothetical protein